MNTKQATQLLKEFNAWRRGENNTAHLNPYDVGIAIDVAVEALENKEAMLRDAAKNEPELYMRFVTKDMMIEYT